MDYIDDEIDNTVNINLLKLRLYTLFCNELQLDSVRSFGINYVL